MHILNVINGSALCNYFAKSVFKMTCIISVGDQKSFKQLLVTETGAALCGLPGGPWSFLVSWKLYSVCQIYQARVVCGVFPSLLHYLGGKQHQMKYGGKLSDVGVFNLNSQV